LALGMEPSKLAHKERSDVVSNTPPASVRFTTYQRILPMPISSVDNLIAGFRPRGFASAGLPGSSPTDPIVSFVLGARKKGDEDEGEGDEGDAGEEGEEEDDDEDGDDDELDEFEDDELDEFDDEDFDEEFEDEDLDEEFDDDEEDEDDDEDDEDEDEDDDEEY